MSVHKKRVAVARLPNSLSPKIALARLLFWVIAPSTAFLMFVGVPRFLPSLSLISLAIAGLFAVAAWATSAKRATGFINLWDVSGAYAFVGFAAGMLSEPMQLFELTSELISAEVW